MVIIVGSPYGIKTTNQEMLKVQGGETFGPLQGPEVPTVTYTSVRSSHICMTEFGPPHYLCSISNSQGPGLVGRACMCGLQGPADLDSTTSFLWTWAQEPKVLRSSLRIYARKVILPVPWSCWWELDAITHVQYLAYHGGTCQQMFHFILFVYFPVFRISSNPFLPKRSFIWFPLFPVWGEVTQKWFQGHSV